MGKNKKINKNKATVAQNGNLLPQNIISVGERVEGNKNIYISQTCYRTINRFTEGKTENESGGMLVGHIIEEFGKTNIVITGFVEAKFCDATPTTIKFTHKTWEYCHKEIDKKYQGQKIVGWIHTHPNFGIFLSEYDKFIQNNFFKEDYQIAYVIDPIQNIEGFYFWIDGKIERCKSFYIFDKTGVKLSIKKHENENEKSVDTNKEDSVLSMKNIIITVLIAATIFLTFSFFSLRGEIAKLKNNWNVLNNNDFYLKQEISRLTEEVNRMKKELQLMEQAENADENSGPTTNSNDKTGESNQAEGQGESQ